MASQLYGRPVHVRCLARVMTLETLEQRERIGRDLERARAMQKRAEELFDSVRQVENTCPVCGERLGANRGVLFQGDSLVHADCWRADPKPSDAPPPAE
jgi:hypothetical protein